jgi:hypothetical protein
MHKLSICCRETTEADPCLTRDLERDDVSWPPNSVNPHAFSSLARIQERQRVAIAAGMALESCCEMGTVHHIRTLCKNLASGTR